MGFSEVPKLICVHGRFQPFHLGHLNYFQEAQKLGEHLIIGLAATFPVSNPIPGTEHRAMPLANPLTYLERMFLIRAALGEVGIPLEQFSFVPFPIDEPEKIPYVIPKNVVCATTSLYEWNNEKIRRLQTAGYRVHVLDSCIKVSFDGKLIRELVIRNDLSWKDMVPAIVADLLEHYKFRERLLALAGQMYGASG